jgi:hypothetical protein
MNFKTSKKMIALALAVVLALSSAVSAFAAWPSFQNTNTNNGVVATQPPITPTTPTTVTLPTSGTIGTDVFSGVDTTSVIDSSGVAYTLYNGGILSGAAGGARLRATNLASPSTPVWDVQIDSANLKANNVQQLSTPALDGNGNLYLAGTWYENILTSTGVTGWTDANDQPLTSFDFPVGTTTIYYNSLSVPGSFWVPQIATDINSMTATISGTASLSNTGTTINFGTSSYYSGNFTIYNNSGSIVPQGTYRLAVSITTSEALSATSFEFLVSSWYAYKATDLTAATPTFTSIGKGYGQTNTPITITSNGNYVYFGVYEGDRAYYQYDVNAGALNTFLPPGGDDFYFAGAADVVVDTVEYVAFGGDNSFVYVRPVGARFADNTQGNTVKVSNGRIRSSVVAPADDTNVYFSSQGASNTNATLNKIVKSDLTDPSAEPTYLTFGGSGASTSSTPVVSANGYVYVGYNVSFSSGGVVAVPTGFTSATSPTDIYSGDPVQSSPIAYSVTTPGALVDYIYFTTNSGSGAGYCYYNDISGSDIDEAWTLANTSGNKYSVQGMASDNAYLIWGDDGNNLYIAH